MGGDSHLPAWLRPRLTYANVVSTICLFVVLGGGAYAATSAFVKKGQIRGCVAGNRSLSVLKNTDKKCPKNTSPVSWAQRGPAGPIGPSNAISRKVAEPACATGTLTCSQTVRLTGLKPGSYVVSAKAWATSPDSDSYTDSEDCTLTAGTHTDESVASLARDDTTGLAVINVPVALQVAHRFSAAGQVTLTCLSATGNASVRNVWITAVKVGAVSIG